MRPGGLKISAKAAECFLLFGAKRGRPFCEQRGNVVFDSLLRLKSCVPTAFEFSGHQPIGWINGIVLPAGMSDIERRLLQRQFKLTLGGRRCLDQGVNRLHRRVDADRLQNAQDFRRYGAISPSAGYRDATRPAMVCPRSIALVAPVIAAVEDM